MILHPLNIKAKLLLPYRETKGTTVAIFCNGGIGNVLMMKDMIHAFRDHEIWLIYYNDTICRLIVNLHWPVFLTSFESVQKHHFDVAVCNFLNCQKRTVKKIIDMRIPMRICHDRGKFNPVFNIVVPFNHWESEVKQNLALYDYYSAI